MSAHGEVISDLRTLRGKIIEAGWTSPPGLVRKARDFLGAVAQDGREPTIGEMIQAAALLSVAAELQLTRTGQPDRTRSDLPTEL